MIVRTMRRLAPAAVLLAVAASMPSLWVNAADDSKRLETLQNQEWRCRSEHLHRLSSLRGHVLLVPRAGCNGQHFCPVAGRRIEDTQPRQV